MKPARHSGIALPDCLNPVLAMELNRGLKSRQFPILILAVLGVMLMAFFSSLSVAAYSGMAYGMRSRHMTAEWFLNEGFLAFPILLILPIAGLVNLRRERAAHLLELAYLSPQTPWHILYGKFLSLMSLLTLALLTALPILVLRYYLGGVNVAEDLIVALYLVGGAACACAGGLLLATYRRPLLVLLVLGLLLPIFMMIIVPAVMLLGYCASQRPLLVPPVLWFAALILLHFASLRLSPPVTQWKTSSRLSLFFFCASSLLLLGVGRAIPGFHVALLVFLPFVVFNSIVVLQIDHPGLCARTRLRLSLGLPLAAWFMIVATQGWDVATLAGFTGSFVAAVLIPYALVIRYANDKDWGTSAWYYVFVQMIVVFVAILIGLLLGDGQSARYAAISFLPVAGLLASVNGNLHPAAAVIQAGWAVAGIYIFRAVLARCRRQGWPPLQPPTLLIYQRAALESARTTAAGAESGGPA